MKIVVKQNNKFLELDVCDLKKIGSGKESRVYKYKDLAIKIHRRNPIKVILSYDDVSRFQNIETKRILLPKNHIYIKESFFHKKNYIGYTTKLVKDNKYIINLSSNKLYKECSILKKDIKILSSKNILIDDLWNEENFIYNGKLYFVDPGSYYIDKRLSTNNIYDLNMEEVSMALYKHLFCLDNRLEDIHDELKNLIDIDQSSINVSTILPIINKIYEGDYTRNFLNSNKKYYLEYLKYILDKYTTISNYKLKILKEYAMDSNSEPIYSNYIKKIIK